jgi:hypothetical protein
MRRNARSSPQNRNRFPLHVVCEWIGNSVPIAEEHYLQVTDDHYADAVTIPTLKVGGTDSGTVDRESGTAICRTIMHRLARCEKSPAKPGCLAA